MQRTALLMTLCSLVACNRADEAAATPAATPAQTAATAAAPTPTPSPAKEIPPAPELPPLPLPGGPEAPGNVDTDVKAALAAKDCAIVEGKLVSCAAVDAFRSATSDFVHTEASAHVRTIFNLLGAEEPAVRLLVLGADPVQYASVYAEDRERDPTLYEPLIAAALREEHPDVRGSFAFEVARVPVYAEHPRLVPHLGAIGERYTAEQEGTQIVSALAELGDACKECTSALVGIADRNPDPIVRIAALEAIAAREGVAAETVCRIAAANLDVEDEELARPVIALFTAEEPSCKTHWDAWLDRFAASVNSKGPSSVSLAVAQEILAGEHGKTHAARIRAVAKELLATVPEDDERRGSLEGLAEES